MTIRLRLISLFAVIVLSLFIMEAISVNLYEHNLHKDRAIREETTTNIQMVKDSQLAWRKQVQAWENVLLRGQSPEQFHTLLEHFYRQERDLRSSLDDLSKQLANNPEYLSQIDLLRDEVRGIGKRYRKALQLFDQSLDSPYQIADRHTANVVKKPDIILERLLLALVKERDKTIAAGNDTVKANVRLVFIGECILALLLLIILIWVIERTLGAPLQKVTDVARHITAGDLTVRVTERLPGEFNLLSKAFNTMIDGIHQTTQKLTDKVSELEEENKIRVQAEKDLQNLTADLIQAQKEIESHTFDLEKAVKERTKELWRQANYDRLTGLPNRSLFSDRLNQALHNGKRYDHQVALLFIDLDHFKRLNDTLGHDIGDLVLKEAATRLNSIMREADSIARLGGDEFIVILTEVENDSEAAHVASKVLELFEQPFSIPGHVETYLSASIGISFYPQDGHTRNDLLKHADAAMYRAKEQGRNKFAYYTVDISNEILKRLKIEHELRKSDFDEDFHLNFQPLFDIKSNKIVAAEALLRWVHPTQGLISPVDFIPAAEETGMIISLGNKVLRKACLQQVAWQQQGLSPIRIAVNISPIQFSHPNFLIDLKSVIEETGIHPEQLELEITESCLMLHATENIALLDSIKALGMSLSIDDFGTGYSSLNYLKRFPVDNLKIDKSFVLDVLDDTSDMAICKAVVAMGHSLGLNIIAEGVETAEHQAFLMDIGCNELQGFYLGRPCSAEKFEPLLASQPLSA